jgi:hypothetical protein
MQKSWKVFKGVKGTAKFNILALMILVLVARLFFYIDFGDKALAESQIAIQKIDPEIIDPMNKIMDKSGLNKADDKKICQTLLIDEKIENNVSGADFKILLENYPMEVMADEIAKKDKSVAAFLIGIAKKESDWGKHAPKKEGRDCFNYWGYRGGYNPTDSGYSCFDSPEQAVSVVAERIEDLVDKKINTPERMIVWKCGRTCAGHDPAGVKKWIADVSFYFNKFNS